MTLLLLDGLVLPRNLVLQLNAIHNKNQEKDFRNESILMKFLKTIPMHTLRRQML